MYKLGSLEADELSLLFWSVNIAYAFQEPSTYQSYSAVSISWSILELTTSKIRFSAVFLPIWNFSNACKITGPPREVDVRASYNNVCSSWHADSKCSKFVRIWTICPGYCVLRRSIKDWQTFSLRSSSRDYTNMSIWSAKGSTISESLPFVKFRQLCWCIEIGRLRRGKFGSKNCEYQYNKEDTFVRMAGHRGICNRSVMSLYTDWATHFCSLGSFSGLYQETSRTLLYSSIVSIGMGI